MRAASTWVLPVPGPAKYQRGLDMRYRLALCGVEAGQFALEDGMVVRKVVHGVKIRGLYDFATVDCDLSI